MNTIISDTSVLIDLERGSLLEYAFRLPLEFVVPDLLYELELKDHNGPALIKLGLSVQVLDSTEVALALRYRSRSKALSLPDVFAFTLAKVNSWTLLSGDSILRKLAIEEGVTCHGVLWLLDRLYEQREMDRSALHDGLRQLAVHPRCRLPRTEVNERLHLYSTPYSVHRELPLFAYI